MIVRLIHGIIGVIIGVMIFLFSVLWVPQFRGYDTFYVSSGSMEPAVRVGDAIYVKACEFDELQVNDIVTYSFNQGRTIITHRIVELDKEKRILRTKGDANEEADAAWISEDVLIGRVDYHLPRIGMIACMLSTGFGKLLVLGFILWFLAAELAMEQWMVPGKQKVVCNEKI